MVSCPVMYSYIVSNGMSDNSMSKHNNLRGYPGGISRWLIFSSRTGSDPGKRCVSFVDSVFGCGSTLLVVESSIFAGDPLLDISSSVSLDNCRQLVGWSERSRKSKKSKNDLTSFMRSSDSESGLEVFRALWRSLMRCCGFSGLSLVATLLFVPNS